jgi:uncharacterized protein YigE (DUF2233 family)
MRYYVTYTDDAKRHIHLYLMKMKDQAFEKYKAFEAWLWTQHGKKVKVLQVDNGGEYTNNEFKSHLAKQGTEL